MHAKRTRTVRAFAVCAAAVALAVPAAAAAAPITEEPSDLPRFIGKASQPDPLTARARPPRHPHMAANERSNLHVDAYQTDTNVLRGPLGRDSETTSTQQIADCGSVNFDSRGRIVTACVGLQGPTLHIFDPRTLDDLASMTLPPRQPGGTGSIFTDFAGGGYFYLDDKDQAIIPTTTRHLFVISETGGPGIQARA